MSINTDVYSVYLDGRPIERGLVRAQADAFAQRMAQGICRNKASDKRRAPELTVKVDVQIVRADDALYAWAKTE